MLGKEMAPNDMISSSHLSNLQGVCPAPCFGSGAQRRERWRLSVIYSFPSLGFDYNTVYEWNGMNGQDEKVFFSRLFRDYFFTAGA